jgi:hypothetical protein
MKTYNLINENRHLFIEIDHNLYLLDTGAPSSFSNQSEITIEDMSFNLSPEYMGLNTEKLTNLVNVNISGLLGADVLNNFDYIIDVGSSELKISKDEISFNGNEIDLTFFMGIPKIEVSILDKSFQMFLDTGAQISYLQDDLLKDFEKIDTLKDFYPGFGEFETDVYQVETKINGKVFKIKYGQLPDLLGLSLGMGSATGIIGNEILQNQVVGYFPRRKKLVTRDLI